jgi:hypothetical protein
MPIVYNQRMFRMLIILLIFAFPMPAYAADANITDFDSLAGFTPVTFPSIESHTAYAMGREGEVTFVHAIANASASGLATTEEFDVFDTPIIRWRWRIRNTLKRGDATLKSGDDYAARLYIIFTREAREAPLLIRMSYALMRKIYGEDPPHSSLNYIWANREQSEVVISPYTRRSRMIPLRWGDDQAGQWIVEEVNIVEDYKRAFGNLPPRKARIAVMTDTDNTGEYTEAWYDYIAVTDRRD